MNEKTVFTGGLKFISLADIIQLIGGNCCTGVLRLSNQYTPDPGLIYFVNGDPINAVNGSLHGLDAIDNLFGWAEGKFEFYEEKVQASRIVNKNRMQIVLDALRKVDDGEVKRVGEAPNPFPKGLGECGTGRNSGLSLVKGPFTGFSYIIMEERFRAGEVIVREGGYGNWIWVILEGAVKVTRKTSRGHITVAKLGEGCFIGTLASLLHKENSRTATVTAMGDVQLGLLDTLRLSGEYTALSSDFKRLLQSVTGRLIKITDRTVDFSINKYKQDKLKSDKNFIIKEGKGNEEIYAITEGETCLMGHGQKGYFPLLTLEKKDVFGYLPFMDIGHEPYNASVLASEDLKVSRLDVESINREYHRLSGTFRSLIYNMGTCISETTRMAYNLQDGQQA